MNAWIQDPRKIDKSRLAKMVGAIQEFLYLDFDPRSKSEVWNRDKEVGGGDLVEFIDGLMNENGMAPRSGPTEWSPRKRQRED